MTTTQDVLLSIKLSTTMKLDTEANVLYALSGWEPVTSVEKMATLDAIERGWVDSLNQPQLTRRGWQQLGTTPVHAFTQQVSNRIAELREAKYRLMQLEGSNEDPVMRMILNMGDEIMRLENELKSLQQGVTCKVW